jgi:thioredoxin reductase (NADPH)
MRAMPGSELLARTRSAHPDAKRILLIDYGDQRMLQVIAHGMALGHVEYYLTKPWRPRQHLLYPVVGEALVAWTRLNSPGLELVRIVGDHWDPVSFELRDALERNRVPYGFTTATPPRGRAARAAGRGSRQPGDLPGRRAGTDQLHPGRNRRGRRCPGPAQARRLRPGRGRGRASRPERRGVWRLRRAVYLVLESTAMGGQAGTSSRIRNFLGFPAGISGSELAERAFQQAWMFGAEFVFINGAARRLDVRLSKGTFAMSAARRAPDQLDMRPPSLHISACCTKTAC